MRSLVTAMTLALSFTPPALYGNPGCQGNELSDLLRQLRAGECHSGIQGGLRKLGSLATPGLVEVMKDKTSKSQQCAALILQLIMDDAPDPGVIQPLVDVIKDDMNSPAPRLYTNCIIALGSILHGEKRKGLLDAKALNIMKSHERLIPFLLDSLRQVLSNPKLLTRGSFNDNNTAAALADFGSVGVKPLLNVAEDPNEAPLVRVWVIRALGFMEAQAIDARPALQRLIGNQAQPAIIRGEAEAALRSIEKRPSR